MKNKPREISFSFKREVVSVMDRVMKDVLVNDPFMKEKHHTEKPLYAGLVPDEIFKGSHFERKFVTPFDKIWITLAVAVAQKELGHAESNKSITGTISLGRLNRINEILYLFERPEKEKKKIKHDWNKELQYILKGKGKHYPVTVVCDVYAEDLQSGKKFVFELKTPPSNSVITKTSKEKIFKLYAMEPQIIDEAFFALPYNPYGTRQNYNWSFPARWFNMKNDPSVLIGDEFWDKLGGKGTCEYFISEINKIGSRYKKRIFREYLEFQPA